MDAQTAWMRAASGRAKECRWNDGELTQREPAIGWLHPADRRADMQKRDREPSPVSLEWEEARHIPCLAKVYEKKYWQLL